MNKTILYYTSNKEDPEFEQKIINDLLSKKGDLQLVSVSQKPMDLGKNICVGNVGMSYINEWRQILIGAKIATTPYLIMAESDFLYSPEYFQFEPKGGLAYRYDNLYIIWKDLFHKARRKSTSEGAMIINRKYLIEFIENFLKDFPEWQSGYAKLPSVLPFETFHEEIPCISFKTGQGVRTNTNYLHGPENKAFVLHGWGHVKEIRSKFL